MVILVRFVRRRYRYLVKDLYCEVPFYLTVREPVSPAAAVVELSLTFF